MRGPANSQIIVRMTSACSNRLARVLAGLVVAICLPASYAQNNAVSTGGASTMVHSMEDLQTSLPLMCKVRDHDTGGWNYLTARAALHLWDRKVCAT